MQPKTPACICVQTPNASLSPTCRVAVTVSRVSETLFTLTVTVNKTVLLKKEVARLRHHVSQLAKKLSRKEEELRVERGKGRGVIIQVVGRKEERVIFKGGGEVVRAPVEEEEVVVVRVRLPSVAGLVAALVAPSVAQSMVSEEVAEEVGVEQLTMALAVAEDAGRASVAMVRDEEEERMLGVEMGKDTGLSGLEGISRRLLWAESGMSLAGEEDVRVELEKSILGQAPMGPKRGCVLKEKNKKRKVEEGLVQNGMWGVVSGVPVQGVSVPTGPRVMARPLVHGSGGNLAFVRRGGNNIL